MYRKKEKDKDTITMWNYLVLEKSNENLHRTLSYACFERGLIGMDKNELNTERKINFFSTDDSCKDKIKWDVVVMSPGYRIVRDMPEIRCFAAVIPGSIPAEELGFLHAETIVTYGMSQKDTITASSVEDEVFIAIQRELITLNGERVEEQEFPMVHLPEKNIDHVMAVAAGLLLLGKLPEREK